MTTSDSQSSQEQWTKENTKVSRRKDVTKVFQEAALLSTEREASWRKSCKESQNRGIFVDTNGRVKVSQQSG